jgi:hypothetical protein
MITISMADLNPDKMEAGIIVRHLRRQLSVLPAKEMHLKRVGFRKLQETGKISNTINNHDIPLQYNIHKLFYII